MMRTEFIHSSIYLFLDESGNISYSNIKDVDFCDKLIEKLSHLAYKDVYTGLYNRNMWEHMIAGNVIIDNIKYYSLALMDIDYLKDINDKFGHLEGDKVIKYVAQIITSSVRDRDIVIRYGGDEFMILFLNKDEKQATNIVNLIREKVSNIPNEYNRKIDISEGISFGNKLSDLLKVMHEADRKMYKQKSSKRK